MSLARRLTRRSPKLFTEADGSVRPLRKQWSKVLRVKALDPTYRRLMNAALAAKVKSRG